MRAERELIGKVFEVMPFSLNTTSLPLVILPERQILRLGNLRRWKERSHNEISAQAIFPKESKLYLNAAERFLALDLLYIRRDM